MGRENEKELNKIVSSKKLDGNWPVEKILSILESIKGVNAKIRSKKRLGKILLVLGIIGISIGVVVADNNSYSFLAWPLIIIFLLIFLYGLFLYFTSRKKEFGDDFHTYLWPLLNDLKEDIDSKEVSVFFDLLPFFSKKFKKGSSRKYKHNSYTCKDYYYERKLCSITIPLVDGNILSIDCKEFSIDFQRKRGKKEKHKYKRKFNFNLRLAFKPQKYKIKSLDLLNSQNISFKEKGKRNIIGIKFVQKEKGLNKYIALSHHLTLQNIIALYGSIMPVKSKGIN